jgi:serine/threonine-protein phosphatase 2A regulatory subunit A
MAEELGKFIPLVGGPAHGHVLLQPLEALSMVEETVVRDKAVESINLVAAELPEASISEHLIPLVQVRAATYSTGLCWCRRS